MASLRSVLFFALAAVAAQSATIDLPTLLASSGSLQSLGGSNLLSGQSSSLADAGHLLANIRMMNNAGSLLSAAVRSGMLSLSQAMEVTNAMMRSSLEITHNPMARLMDGIHWAVHQTRMMELGQAIQMLVRAYNSGLHTAENMTDAALVAFLEAAASAESLSSDVTQRLRNYILSSGESTGTTFSSFSSSGSNGGASLTVSSHTTGDNRMSHGVGLLYATVRSGMISNDQARDVINSMVRSALENTPNPMVRIMDGMQWAIDNSLIIQGQAMQIIAMAVNQGLHNAQNMSDLALAAFVEASASAENISRDIRQRIISHILSHSSVPSASITNDGGHLVISADTDGDNRPDVQLRLNV